MRVGLPPAAAGMTEARVWFGHYGTGAASITGVRIGASATRDGVAGASGWTDCGDAEIPLAAATTAVDGSPIPSEGATPWVTLPTVARSDGGTQLLLDVLFRVGAGPYQSPGVADPPNDNTVEFSSGWTNSASNWYASPPASETTYPYNGGWCWLEFRGPVNAAIKSVALVGDSITDGASHNLAQSGYLQRACYARGIHYTGMALPGRTTRDSIAESVRRINAPGLYDAVFLRAWSPNDELDGQAEADVWALYLAERARLEGLGYLVLTESPLPCSVFAAPIPLNIKNRLIAAGHPFCDSGREVATDNTMETWLAWATNDNIHPNILGIENYLQPLFQTYLASVGL